MTKPKVDLKHLADCAAHLFSTQGDIQPMWVLATDTEVVPIIAMFSDQKEKDEAAELVRKKAKEIGAKIVGFICEAWQVSVTVKKEDFDNEVLKEIVPSEHEDRREIVQVYYEGPDGIRAGCYYILRPEHGPATLSPFKEWPNDGTIGGTFTRILDPANGQTKH